MSWQQKIQELYDDEEFRKAYQEHVEWYTRQRFDKVDQQIFVAGAIPFYTMLTNVEDEDATLPMKYIPGQWVLGGLSGRGVLPEDWEDTKVEVWD